MIVDDLVSVVAPPDVRSPADVRRAAVHEAGHAVAQIALGGAVESVTIVAAAGSGGHTRMGASASPFPTAADLDAAATMMLAGRAAEAGHPWRAVGGRRRRPQSRDGACLFGCTPALGWPEFVASPRSDRRRGGASAQQSRAAPGGRPACCAPLRRSAGDRSSAPRSDRRGRRRARPNSPADRSASARDLRAASRRRRDRQEAPMSSEALSVTTGSPHFSEGQPEA